jgi:hypothetical protein
MRIGCDGCDEGADGDVAIAGDDDDDDWEEEEGEPDNGSVCLHDSKALCSHRCVSSMSAVRSSHRRSCVRAKVAAAQLGTGLVAKSDDSAGQDDH